MDLVKLDDPSYQIVDLVEEWDSLVWTERYLTPGDFSLTTSRIEETMDLLPEGSLVSLQDTQEVMIVENQLIEYDDEGLPKLKLTGRTFESFLEQREVGSGPPAISTTMFMMASFLYKPSDAAALLLYFNQVANAPADGRPADLIPNTCVSISPGITGESTDKDALELGMSLHEGVMQYLGKSDLGIRMIRPTTYNVPVAVPNLTGTVPVSTVSTVNSLRFDVYQGVDRTRDQSAVTPVVFDYRAGHLSNPSYLYSKKNFFNVAYCWTKDNAYGILVYAPGVSSGISGRARRILLVDCNDILDKTAGDRIGFMTARGKRMLKKHREKMFNDGQVTTACPYKFKTHYNLGDQVTLVARAGGESNKVVSEYVRVQDADGVREYPTLV